VARPHLSHFNAFVHRDVFSNQISIRRALTNPLFQQRISSCPFVGCLQIYTLDPPPRIMRLIALASRTANGLNLPRRKQQQWLSWRLLCPHKSSPTHICTAGRLLSGSWALPWGSEAQIPALIPIWRDQTQNTQTNNQQKKLYCLIWSTRLHLPCIYSMFGRL
jgi:hypothetical protein